MATHYVTQTGAGAHDGTSLADAWSVAEHNAATIPNDTVSLNGTITSTVICPSDGVYYLLALGALLTSPIWNNSTGAIYVNQKNNVTIDGGGTLALVGNSWMLLVNGIIENTANGSGLANSAPSRGIQGINANGLIVKNLWVRNIYVRTDDADLNDNDSSCISNKAAAAEVIDGFEVTNCTLDNAYRGIEADYGVGCSDYVFSYINATRCNWGAGVGDRGAGKTLARLTCHHMAVSDWTNWNEPGTNAYHHNGIFAFSNHDDAIITDIVIHSCRFGPGWGNEFQTAGIYMNTGIVNPLVYNNLFVCDPGESAANGLITMQSTSATTFGVYNNTFIGGGSGTCVQLAGSGNGNAITMNVKNNLGVGNGGGTFIALYTNPNVTLNADYNLGFDFTAALAYSYSANGSGNFKTFAQWQALGFDTHGLNSDPLLTAIYTLGAGSPAIGAGVNLSSIFTDDYDGEQRINPWDMGAFAYTITPVTGTGIRTSSGFLLQSEVPRNILQNT